MIIIVTQTVKLFVYNQNFKLTGEFVSNVYLYLEKKALWVHINIKQRPH